MLTSEFHVRARAFLNSLLRQRDYLTITHKGKKPVAEVSFAASFIRLHLDANGYSDNRKMARFWFHHQDKIRTLLPGLGSTSHLYSLDQFNNLLWESGLYQLDLFNQKPRFDYESTVQPHKN